MWFHLLRCYRSSSLSMCLSVTLIHPAEAVGENEMPFGRDTRLVSNNIILDRVPTPLREGGIWGSELPVYSNASYRQIMLALLLHWVSISFVIVHWVATAAAIFCYYYCWFLFNRPISPAFVWLWPHRDCSQADCHSCLLTVLASHCSVSSHGSDWSETQPPSCQPCLCQATFNIEHHVCDTFINTSVSPSLVQSVKLSVKTTSCQRTVQVVLLRLNLKTQINLQAFLPLPRISKPSVVIL